MTGRRTKENFYRLMGPLLWANGAVCRWFRAPAGGFFRVQLGPGREKYVQGWINVDANPSPSNPDVWAALRNPLPFRDGTADAFYSHHAIEHRPDATLAAHFRDMYRCLKPGGAIRVGGPNGEVACQNFAAGDASWFDGFDFPDRHASLGGRLANFIFCRGEHFTILTIAYLREFAAAAGFAKVTPRVPAAETGHPRLFDSRVHGLDWEQTPDAPLIEAIKPGGASMTPAPKSDVPPQTFGQAGVA